jgi:ribonuclease P protein component
MNQRFYKTERLKSRKAIEELFNKGEKIYSFPLKLIYIINENPKISSHQVAFSVSKKCFKKAVFRNKIKRRMREAYRKNKHILYEITSNKKFNFMFIFIDNKDYSYAVIEEKTKIILNKLREILIKTEL